MASAEYAELHGLSGVAVAAKAAIQPSDRQKALLFFVQALSMQPGGLKKVAADIAEKFPECLARLARTMSQPFDRQREHLARQAEIVRKLRGEEGEPVKPATRSAAALNVEQLERFLVELCINPKIEVADAALFEFQRQWCDTVPATFVRTEVAKQVFAALDDALALRRIAFIEGNTGVGKTEAAEAWVHAHLGEARLIKLTGAVTKTEFFRQIAASLGLASSYSRTLAEIQPRVQDVLQRGRIALVIDEAHQLLPTGERVYAQPDLVNWCYTACETFKIPIALLTTALFKERTQRISQQIVWNFGNFERRMTYTVLLDKTAKRDLEAIARRHLPELCESALLRLIGYAGLSRYPLSNLITAIERARRIAATNGKDAVGYESIDQAILKYQVPSDTAKAAAFGSKKKESRPASPVQERDVFAVESDRSRVSVSAANNR